MSYPARVEGLVNMVIGNFLLVGQHWHVHVMGFLGERLLWVRPCFSSSVSHALFVLFGWFLRWEVSGRISVVLWDVVSRICPIDLVAFLCSSRLAFSLNASSESLWCIHTVELTQLLLTLNKNSNRLLVSYSHNTTKQKYLANYKSSCVYKCIIISTWFSFGQQKKKNHFFALFS